MKALAEGRGISAKVSPFRSSRPIHQRLVTGIDQYLIHFLKYYEKPAKALKDLVLDIKRGTLLFLLSYSLM